jgi:hypothetical protein
MKVVLAMEHGLIPPTIGLINPNPNSKLLSCGRDDLISSNGVLILGQSILTAHV